MLKWVGSENDSNEQNSEKEKGENIEDDVVTEIDKNIDHATAEKDIAINHNDERDCDNLVEHANSEHTNSDRGKIYIKLIIIYKKKHHEYLD
jgi:hypothetical protein